MKNNQCHYYGKGGWCGLLHEKEITRTKKGKTIRTICVRCSEILSRNSGECKHYKSRAKNDTQSMV